MESRQSNDAPAQMSADRDAASAQNESASPPTLSREDLDEIGASDIGAPLAAVPGVLELSEDVQDRIAADNDALTDAFAAQALEQSSPDEDASSPRTQNQARIGAVAVAGFVASAVMIAVVRRLRRGHNKASGRSSQRVSGSTRGSREGAGSVRSGGSHGLKSSAARSQSRRGGSTTTVQGTRRGEARSEAARSRSDRPVTDRVAAESTASCAVDRTSSAGDSRAAAAKAKAAAAAPVAAPEAAPARKKRVPPLLSGNRARSRSDKDSESDKPTSASSTAGTKGSPATDAEKPISSTERRNGSSDASQPASATFASAPPEVQLNVNAQEFRPRSNSGDADSDPVAQGAGTASSAAAVTFASTPELLQSTSQIGHAQISATGQAAPTEQALSPADAPVAELHGQIAEAAEVAAELPVQRSKGQVEKTQFNVDAPAFRPSSAVNTMAQKGDLAPAKETPPPHGSMGESEQEAPGPVSDTVGETGDVQDIAGPAADSVSAMDGDDKDLEFAHRNLELAGKDIAADAEETADEKLAAEQLLDLAKELQRMGGGRATAAELQEKGLKELKHDVHSCMSGQCRPLKVAEHASTAADFFFQLQLFDAAEEMLDIGVQAARMAGDAALETTLMHNLATALRKRGKYNMALMLHRSFKADIEAREGITSEYVVLARHSIVDILTTRKRGDECREYLDQEVAKLEEHLETVKAENTMVAQERTGESDDAKLARALQALARCKLDYAKHFEACERQDDAIAMGRDALARHRAAAEMDPGVTVPMYANFLAVQLRVKGHRLKAEGQDEEALTLYRESRDMFTELAAIVEMQETQGRKNRRLPMVYQQIADISMDLKDFETALKATDQFVSSIMSVYQCRPSDPSMHQVWEFKAGIHSAANDTEGAANAHKQALKCKSSIARARGSHKSKQRKDARG
eukprot:jgi/Ulvmu1/8288/UM041_0100.1